MIILIVYWKHLKKITRIQVTMRKLIPCLKLRMSRRPSQEKRHLEQGVGEGERREEVNLGTNLRIVMPWWLDAATVLHSCSTCLGAGGVLWDVLKIYISVAFFMIRL